MKGIAGDPPYPGTGEQPPVTAIIPAWNEAGRIGATVRSLKSVPGVDHILVVDDGSTDQTADEAAAAGARVLRLPRRRGKAAAVQRGLAATGAPVVLLLDADIGDSAHYAGALLAPVLAGEADMTVGRLPPSGRGGGFGLVVGTARWALRRKTGALLEQPLSGQRAIRRAALAAVDTWGWGFGLEFALSMQLIKAGYVVREVDTGFAHRVTEFAWRHLLHRARQLAHVGITWLLLALRG